MVILKKICSRVSRLVNVLEDASVPLAYYFASFFFVINLRNFLEILILNNFDDSVNVYFHYLLFYVALAVVLIWLFNKITKEDVLKTAKVVLASFTIIATPPIIDFVISGGEGFKIAYIVPANWTDVFTRFFTFFGRFENFEVLEKSGATIGIRIEVFVVVVASFFYFYIKTRKKLLSFLGSFFVYATIFVSFLTFFLIRELSEGVGLQFNSSVIPKVYLLIIFFVGLRLAYVISKDKFKILAGDIRLTRILHYVLMFILGVCMGYRVLGNKLGINEVAGIVVFIIALVFAWLYSVIENNVADYKIDLVSNPSRPLTSGKMRLDEYRQFSRLFLVLSVIFGSAVGVRQLLVLILFIGNYYLYSMPPLRFKRVTFFSKLAVSGNSLLVVLAGYYTAFYGNPISAFPSSVVWFFVVGFTAAANFIDLKDYEGDKAEGIKTLPVVWGLSFSQKVIGFIFLALYVWFYRAFGLPGYLLPVIVMSGLAQCFLISRKKYSEDPVFWLYLASIFISLFFIGVPARL